jgi:predicted methyltransferase
MSASRFGRAIFGYAAVLFVGGVFAMGWLTAAPALGSEADRARDAGRKPAEVAAFYDVDAGKTVLDIGAGGGYFTEVFSKAVGEKGKVIAQQDPARYEKIKAEFADKLALENVTLLTAPHDATGLADGSVDIVFLSLLWHHMHFAEGSGETLPVASKKTLAEFMRVLKPGGIFAVIDHSSLDTASRAESISLHRAPKQGAIDDITSQGFEFVDESDVLANKADPRNIQMRDVPRDQTDRFMLKFRKPKA